MGMLMRAGTVLATVLTSAVAVVATSTPAGAAYPFPTRCVESFSGETVQIEQFPAAQVVDLDVGLPWRFGNAAEIALVNGQPGQTFPRDRWVLSDRNGGGLRNDHLYVTFDNEAALGYWDQIPPGTSEVRIRPFQQIPRPTSNAVPTWYVEIDRNPGNSAYFTATVTYSDCDEDNDQVGDRTRDNCVGVSNPDQRDRDGDRIGDACDPDNDNDGTADASDNCPALANPDQADWDGDRIGNACDSTPGAAPVTPVPPVPGATTTTPPIVTGIPGCTNSCAYTRTVGLRHQSRRHRLAGTVASVADGCRSAVPVTLWRKRSGQDVKLVVVTTRDGGSFRTKAPRRPGRYYATVGSAAEPLCGAARSRAVKVRRR